MKEGKKGHAEVIGLRVCAWCNDLLGFGKFVRPKEEVGKVTPVSHGMCEDCAEDVLNNLKETVEV